MELERKCNNCTYNVCAREECKQNGVCESHKYEHEKLCEECYSAVKEAGLTDEDIDRICNEARKRFNELEDYKRGE